ncbi:MAG TPA: bifunctional folylpolyglutamate synthase/dihydrofolate synthase, partial [Polyangiaceae bacterium]|nr:bifunctional folylpolyglutamate synthase/dihydrofolate synthase [Polyangiaceae bacterium]
AEPRSRAAAPPAALAALAAGEPAGTLAEALRAAREAVGPRGVVLVCGSVSLVGEARARLLGEAMDPPVGM